MYEDSELPWADGVITMDFVEHYFLMDDDVEYDIREVWKPPELPRKTVVYYDGFEPEGDEI